MVQHTIGLAPLTREAFKPFGDVIETDGARKFSINNGAIERFHDLARIDIGDDPDCVPLLSIAQCNQATSLPFRIRLVERHPLASQAFYPLFDKPMIVAVAPDCEEVAPDTLTGFYTNGKQGINFHRNVWHIPLIALEQGQQFVIVDRGGSGNNCEEFHFDSADELILQRIE